MLQRAFLLGVAYAVGKEYGKRSRPTMDDTESGKIQPRDERGRYTNTGKGQGRHRSMAKRKRQHEEHKAIIRDVSDRIASLHCDCLKGDDALASIPPVEGEVNKQAFNLYSQDSRKDAPYVQVNASANGDADIRLTGEAREMALTMQEYMLNHRIPEAVRLYRGVNPDDYPDLMVLPDGNIEGKEITSKGFCSTSTKAEVAIGFAGSKAENVGSDIKLILVFDVPTGHPAANISKCSAKKGQNEIVLPMGTKRTPYAKLTHKGFVIILGRVEEWKD